MKLKTVVFFAILALSGCSFTPLECSFWMPKIGWKGLQEYNFQKTISESMVGTKCRSNF